ncbi:MBG domain-containing protein, partial [Leucobacter albus]
PNESAEQSPEPGTAGELEPQPDALATLLSASAGLAGSTAPASAAKLAPGTYTVTANPYVAGVDAPIGVNVYMADASFPPVKPQQLNTTLRVAADGAIEVDVPFNQEIFTLQDITDGADVRVASIERGGNIAWGNVPPDPRYPDRIVSVTAQLDNDSGEYTFGPATQYPVPLQVEKHWSIHLSVDFAGAVRQVVGDFTREYRHAATGAAVSVEAEDGDPLIASLTQATLGAAAPAADERGIAAAIGREFVTTPTFASWQLALIGADGPLVLSAAQRTTVTLPTSADEVVVMRIADGVASPVATREARAGSVSFVTDTLGVFALVDSASAARWEHTKEFVGDPGTTMTYRTTGEADMEFPGLDFPSLDSLGAYSSFLGEETAPELLAQAAGLVADGFDNPDVRLYTFGLDVSYENIPGANVAKHWAWMYPMGGGKTSLSATAPTGGPGAEIFLLSGTRGAGLTSATGLAATQNGTSAAFDIVAKDTDAGSPAAMVQVPLWNAATGMEGFIDTPQTAATEIAYVAVVREAVTPVARPSAKAGLVYTGAELSGVPAGEGYSLSVRPSATSAGSYLARATLDEGYIWDDGSTAPLSLPWEIAPAQLTAKYSGETIAPGASPQLALEITGFVGGETAVSAAGFVAPTVEPPARLTAGGRYTLVPAGGSAANYRFAYEPGVLTVTEQGQPAQLRPGSYRITANLYVPGEKNDILGMAAYMTNPKNPLVAQSDPNYGIPTAPVRDNATLVVGASGKRSLLLDLPNPAFTLMAFGTPSPGATVAAIARDGKTYGSHTAGRITQAVLELADASGEHIFSGSQVYAAPLQLDKRWDLSLAVDYASASRVSDDTTVTLPGGERPGEPGGDGGTPGSPGPKPGTGGGAKPRPTGPATGAGQTATQLAAGRYTVSANIWFSRAVTGLPLDPHITNGGFPPKDPVTDNATLVVAADGTGRVTLPVVIQDRIMTVRSLSGGGVVGTGGGSSVTSVTVDLGHIDPRATAVSRSMTASVSIGDLALSIGGPIFGGSREHTWPASFEVTLAGVPTSGGGVVPGFVQAKLPGALSADEQAAMRALEAAREANERSKRAGSASGADHASSGTGDGRSVAAGGALPQPFAIIAAAGLVLALAAGATVIARRRKRLTE